MGLGLQIPEPPENAQTANLKSQRCTDVRRWTFNSSEAATAFHIRVILGSYWDDGNYRDYWDFKGSILRIILGLYWDNGKMKTTI